MILNFQCKSCRTFYDYEVGAVTFDNKGGVLEHYPICPACKKSDQWLLSEWGQTLITEYHFQYMDKKNQNAKK